MTRDDDRDDELEAATPDERARAASLARLVDALCDGRPAPPALEAGERSMLETATVVWASEHPAQLDPARRRELVEGALAASRRGERARTPAPVAVPDVPAPQPVPAAVSARRPRRWQSRGAAWGAAVALAAAIALAVGLRPPSGGAPPRTAALDVPRSLTSRPADALVGRIDRASAADASERMDAIYADRLAGYRLVRLARQGVR